MKTLQMFRQKKQKVENSDFSFKFPWKSPNNQKSLQISTPTAPQTKKASPTSNEDREF